MSRARSGRQYPSCAVRLVQLGAVAALGVGIGGIVTSGAGAQEHDGSTGDDVDDARPTRTPTTSPPRPTHSTSW